MKRYILQWCHKDLTLSDELWNDHYATPPRGFGLEPNPAAIRMALQEFRNAAPHLEWRVISREMIETTLDW